jgi:anti-anti-sigma regulatory factor
MREAAVTGELVGGVCVICVRGAVTGATTRGLRDALRDVLDTRDCPVVLDLTDVDGSGADALPTILNGVRRLVRDDRSLSVVCPPGAAREQIERAGVAADLRLSHDRSAAITRARDGTDRLPG